MFHLSKTAGYAVHALSCIGAALPRASLVREIAVCTQLKKPYLSKIINQLVREGLIETKRGYHGGVVLARPPEEISLLQIVQAIEGKSTVSPCLFGLEQCPTLRCCPAHSRWSKVGREMEDTLRTTPLSAMMEATPAPKRRPRRTTAPLAAAPKAPARRRTAK